MAITDASIGQLPAGKRQPALSGKLCVEIDQRLYTSTAAMMDRGCNGQGVRLSRLIEENEWRANLDTDEKVKRNFL